MARALSFALLSFAADVFSNEVAGDGAVDTLQAMMRDDLSLMHARHNATTAGGVHLRAQGSQLRAQPSQSRAP